MVRLKPHPCRSLESSLEPHPCRSVKYTHFQTEGVIRAAFRENIQSSSMFSPSCARLCSRIMDHVNGRAARLSFTASQAGDASTQYANNNQSNNHSCIHTSIQTVNNYYYVYPGGAVGPRSDAVRLGEEGQEQEAMSALSYVIPTSIFLTVAVSVCWYAFPGMRFLSLRDCIK